MAIYQQFSLAERENYGYYWLIQTVEECRGVDKIQENIVGN